MAAACRAVRAQIGQHMIRVAGCRSTSEAVLGRSQSAAMPNVVPAAIAGEDFGATYPAWRRDVLSGHPRGFATKDGADRMTGAGKTSAASGDVGEEMRVDTMVRDELEEPEGGPEPGLKEKTKQAVSKVGEKVKDAGKAIKGSTDSKTADKVGDTAEEAGDKMKEKGANQTTLGKEDVVTS